jgi:hypothetical protein
MQPVAPLTAGPLRRRYEHAWIVTSVDGVDLPPARALCGAPYRGRRLSDHLEGPLCPECEDRMR